MIAHFDLPLKHASCHAFLQAIWSHYVVLPLFNFTLSSLWWLHPKIYVFFKAIFWLWGRFTTQTLNTYIHWKKKTSHHLYIIESSSTTEECQHAVWIIRQKFIWSGKMYQSFWNNWVTYVHINPKKCFLLLYFIPAESEEDIIIIATAFWVLIFLLH